MITHGRDKGAITVFLCIILTAMLALTGILTDAARIKASGVLAKEAVESSSRSALASYNKMLKDYYGLFSLENSNEDELRDNIESYINKTLMTELGVDKETVGESYLLRLVDAFTGKKQVGAENIFDLYDFSVEELNAKPIYSLAQKDVLNRQIVEQVKYRAPAELAETLFEKITHFKGFGKQSKVLDKKVKIDKDLSKAKDKQEELSDNIEDVNAFDTEKAEDKITVKTKEYNKNLEEKRSLEGKIPTLRNDIATLQRDLDAARDEYNRIINQPKPSSDSGTTSIDTSGIDAEISSLSAQKSQKESELSETESKITVLKQKSSEIKSFIRAKVQTLNEKLKTTSNNIDSLKNIAGNISNKVKALKSNDLDGDNSDFAIKTKQELDRNTSKLSLNTLTEVAKEVANNTEVGNGIIEALQGSDDDPINEQKIDTLINKYNGNINAKAINYKVTKPKKSSNSEDVRKEVKKLEEKTKSETNSSLTENEEKKLKDEDLVSKKTLDEKSYYKEDLEYIKTYINSNFSKTLKTSEKSEDSSLNSDDIRSALNEFDAENAESLSIAKSASFLSAIGNLVSDKAIDLRDKAYLDYYIQNIFKSRLTEIAKNAGKPEKNLFGKPKSDRKTYFNSEIEYLIGGAKTENANNTIVDAQLLLVRFVLNTIAIYMDATKYADAYTAAVAIAGFTVLGVPIVQNLIMIGWAFAEAVIDVKMLIEGKEVPLYKTQGTWVLDKTNAIKGVISKTAKNAANTAIDYGRDKAQDMYKSVSGKVEEIVKEKITLAIDKAFSPVDKAFNTANEYMDSFSEDASNIGLDNVSGDLAELVGQIQTLAEQEYELNGKPLINTLRNCTIDEAEEKLRNIKSEVKDRIYSKVEGIKNKIDSKVKEAVNKGSDELKKYVDSLDSSSSNNGKAQTKLSSCLISMSYQDYLTIFIMLTGRDTVLPRVADLIQLNMRQEDEAFDITRSYTYLRVDGKISVKYLFLGSLVKTESNIGDGKPRYTNNILLYQGY